MAFNPMSLDANYLSNETGLPKDSIIKSNISEAEASFYQLVIDFQRVQNFGQVALNDYRNDIKNINHCLDFIASNTDYLVSNIKHAVNSRINNVSSIKQIGKAYEEAVNY